MIRSFGCKATIHTHCDLHNKLDNHSTPGIHLGIAQGKKAFLVYNPQTCKVNELRDVHFFEKDKVGLEHITIKVESFDSPTHVVVPQDNDVGSRDVNEGVDGNREDSPLSEDEHIPEESQLHHSTHIH